MWRKIRPMSMESPVGGYPIDSSFDEQLANQLAHLESYNKHYYRPNTYLHKWWARRCGTTFRQILKHLVTDEQRQAFYEPGGLNGRIILDPMMGGGTTLHEAIRMGANVIGVDLDPIPVLQARATLTASSFKKLENAFEGLFTEMRGELAGYYATTCPVCAELCESWYVIHGARRSCDCGPVLVVDSLVLRKESDGTLIRLCATCMRINNSSAPCDCGQQGAVRIVEHGKSACPVCTASYEDDLDVPYYARFEPLAVTGHCPRHQFFLKSPDELLRRAMAKAEARRAQLSWPPGEFTVEPGEKSIQLVRRGIDCYLDLFSSRQLLVLDRAISLLPAHEGFERLNLALLISTSLEFNTMLCGYKGKAVRRSGAVRHAFSRHAYTFPNTAVENNPLYARRASGTWQKLFHMRIRRARQWAIEPRERDLSQKDAAFLPIVGEVDGGTEVEAYEELAKGERRFLLQQGSAARLGLPDHSVDSIITDPPYYDSVQYSDLSAYFRVWLRQLLPANAGWQYDVQESAVDPHKNGRDSRYGELMGGIFAECARVLRRPHGRLIFTFHHWNPLAWTALTLALKRADFHLLNYAVVHAEHPMSVHIANMNALTHDAILVFAPDGSAARRTWRPPQRVDKSRSDAFCAGCAQHLGWALAADLTTEKIDAYWQTLIS